MKMPSLAEQHEQAAEIALEHFRDAVLLTFRAMTDGIPERYRKQTREIVRFFEKETTPRIWSLLTMIPDPETGGSLADSWLQQWEQSMATLEAA